LHITWAKAGGIGMIAAQQERRGCVAEDAVLALEDAIGRE
jgi:hypothetical protein